MSKIKLWYEEPRALRADNLGPIEGAHEIGSITGPGIYRIVERNAGGKSTVLNALLKMQEQKLLRQDIQIRDGETVATLELEPGRMTFRRGPTGEIREPERSGIDGLPPITEMPAAIETLIHGDHLQDTDARARRRLKALLSYAPVDSTPERLAGLMETCHGRAFDAIIGADMRRSWLTLAESAGAAKKRMRIEPIRDASEILDWVRNSERRDGSVLTDHEALMDILNATANTGEHAAEEARRALAVVTGRLEEAAKAAERDFGFGSRRQLEAQHDDLETLRSDLSAARSKHASASAQRERMLGEQARRERLAESHGERPDAQAADDAEAAASLECAKAERDWEKVQALRSYLREASAQAVAEWPLQDLTAERIKDAVAGLLSLSAAADGPSLESLRSMRDSARRHRSEVAVAASRWDEVHALLSEPLEGPTAEAVEAAKAAAEEAERALRIATSAAAYQVIAAEHVEALELCAKLDAMAKSYRDAASDSWGYLGKILTNALDLPWLQIDGLKLFVGYVGSRLNNDPGLIRAAEAQAEKLALANDHSSPVALGRFLMEAIREASEVEWRDLDDEKRISTAELHEACLSLMLSRRSKLGGIIVVPWEVVAALDDDRLMRFDAAVAEAGLVLITERPRRVNDRVGIFLERVAEIGVGGAA